MTTLTAQAVRPPFWGVDEQLKSFGHWLLIWVVLMALATVRVWRVTALASFRCMQRASSLVA